MFLIYLLLTFGTIYSSKETKTMQSSFKKFLNLVLKEVIKESNLQTPYLCTAHPIYICIAYVIDIVVWTRSRRVFWKYWSSKQIWAANIWRETKIYGYAGDKREQMYQILSSSKIKNLNTYRIYKTKNLEEYEIHRESWKESELWSYCLKLWV